MDIFGSTYVLKPLGGRPIGCLAPVAPKSLPKSIDIPPVGGGGIVLIDCVLLGYDLMAFGIPITDTLFYRVLTKPSFNVWPFESRRILCLSGCVPP